MRKYDRDAFGEREWEAEAAIQPVAPGGEIQVVGALPLEVVERLGWPVSTTLRTVMLSQGSAIHIVQRRKKQAKWVLANMNAAILRPDAFLPGTGDGRTALIVKKTPDRQFMNLAIALKLVRADNSDTKTDEIWVSSGYGITDKQLRGKRYRALQYVVGS